MTLNSSQHSELIENYIGLIVEGLSTDQLAQICFDLLCERYESYTEGDLIGEIQSIYGDEITANLIESVGADSDTIL